ncbi:TetR/AcrR family transcriptional regulator [Maritalea sp.]|uniref:TetR/AcrR family transcriptional regulator n=1 Tax=Maritalea sp. TaxID=2003361 RepID=UPI003EF95EA4
MSNGASTRIARSKARIIAAAADIFIENGFLGTSMEDIAFRADVSVQTIYTHFQNKEGLFTTVIRDLAGGAASAIGQEVGSLPADITPREWLTKFSKEQLRIVLTPRLMQLRRMIIGEALRFPDLGAALYKAGPGRAIARLTGIFEAFSARGALNIKSPEVAAKQFNWLLMGGPTTEIMHFGDTAIPSHDELRCHAEQTVEMFLAAYE